MVWCEANGVDYVFGLARNPRLVERIDAALAGAEHDACFSGRTARRFADFSWSTRKNWSRKRWVVAKAEWMRGRVLSGIDLSVFGAIAFIIASTQPPDERHDGRRDAGDFERGSERRTQVIRNRVWWSGSRFLFAASLAAPTDDNPNNYERADCQDCNYHGASPLHLL